MVWVTFISWWHEFCGAFVVHVHMSHHCFVVQVHMSHHCFVVHVHMSHHCFVVHGDSCAPVDCHMGTRWLQHHIKTTPNLYAMATVHAGHCLTDSETTWALPKPSITLHHYPNYAESPNCSHPAIRLLCPRCNPLIKHCVKLPPFRLSLR